MEDGVEAEESDKMRGWESKLFILVVVLRCVLKKAALGRKTVYYACLLTEANK